MKKILCKDCTYCHGTKVGFVSYRYWCSKTGNGYNGSALGVYPWKNYPHPKCPLQKEVGKNGNI